MKKTSTAYFLLFAGVISLCIFSLLFYQRIRILMSSYDMVNNATQASLELDRLFLTLRDATVNYRDYVRSNKQDKASYDSFANRLQLYPQILSNLNQLEAGNPAQLEKLKYVTLLTNNYVAFISKSIAEEKSASLYDSSFDRERIKLNNIRKEISYISNEENRILKERNTVLNKHIFTTPFFLLIFSLISVALIIYAFLQIIKQIKQTQVLQLSKAKLKESEERFRQLADLIPQIVWTANTDGYIDYYNKRWYDFTGFEEKDNDQSWVPVLHADDVQVYIDSWYHSVKTGEPYQIEYRFENKNVPGTYRWFLGKALPIKDKDGKIIKWFGTCTDIHDQKNATQQLEQLVAERTIELTERNKDLNEAQRLAHIGSWEWNIKANHVVWSDELYRIYGIEPADFKNTYEDFLFYVFEEDREHLKKSIEEAIVMQKTFDFYHRIQTSKNGLRILHVRGKVHIDNNNETSRISGTAQDITEAVESQIRINELNQTFNFAEQTSLIGSFRYNFSKSSFSYSDNLYRLLGCKPGEFEPTLENFTQFVHPEDLDHILSEESKLSVENIADEYLFRAIKKDSTVIHVRSTGIFITENDERIYIGTLQDVTQQYNKEVQLINQNAELEKMNKELASFSYVASHDLQEPLRKIRMFTRRLLEKEMNALSNDSKEYFNRIEKAASRMQKLIEDLLSYSRTNTLQAHFELTDINKLVQDVSDNLSEKILQTNTVIEASGLQKARVIPFQFQQLFTNLITNSIKFTRRDVAPHIQISHSYINGETFNKTLAIKKGIYHHYTIKDNGIGFEPEYSEQIFGLFQRLHGRNEFEGTGIGLAICKKIVENHNGVITASGDIDKGATFNIYIPVEIFNELN